MTDAPRIGWTQPLCETCFAAWEVGNGRVPREPTRLRGDAAVDGDPCLICGTPVSVVMVEAVERQARAIAKAEAKSEPGSSNG